MNRLPKNVQMLIMNHLSGKNKRVFRHVYNLPKPPQKPQTRMYRSKRKIYRKTGVDAPYLRFNKTPVVYKNKNWKYYLMAFAPNNTGYPIFFRSKKNSDPYIIHPRTGRRKTVNLYNHINATENYTNNMTRRTSKNTWNSYVNRTLK
jgi:hypothetical protein